MRGDYTMPTLDERQNHSKVKNLGCYLRFVGDGSPTAPGKT